MKLALLAAVLLFASLAAAAPLALYVSPAGNDAWSGRLPAANQTKTDGPFATLGRARDELRKLGRGGRPEGAVVSLRGGLYELPETLALGLEDSGAPAAPVVWRAFAGERPVISGGRVLTGLTETTYAGQRAWQVKLPQVAAGDWYFRQLFAKRAGEDYYTRRYRPMKGMLVVAGLTFSPERKTAAHRAAQQDFIFYPGDLQQFENLPDVEVVALHSWSASRLKIKSLDLQNHIVTFTSVPTFKIGAWYRDERNPYYVENVKEELKQPGQWYLDRPTGMLTYLPLPGETLQNTTLTAPRLDKLLTVQGDLDKGLLVQGLAFENLTFAHTDWQVPEQGYDVSQGQPTLPAALELTAAENCAFRGCVVTDTGAYGLGLGLGCHACSVTGCYLYDLGGGGVKVGDSTMRQQASAPVLPTDNVIENNTITCTGVGHFSANGIWCGIVRGTKIRHNEVSRNPYTGIAVGWCWGPSPTSCGGNLIERNYVHHVMDLVQDGGGIYTLGFQPETVVRGNVIHDNHRSPFACADGQCGLYFDEGSSGFLVEDNIQYRVDYEQGKKIAQNRNEGPPHVIRNNYLAVAPEDPAFPKELASQAGVQPGARGAVYPVSLPANPVYTMKLPQLTPLPVALDLTFEDVPIGRMPRRFAAAGFTEQAYFGVTAETACGGARSLKIQDAAGLGKSFYPYVQYSGYEVSTGQVTLSFDVQQKADAAGRFAVDVRDYATKDAGEFASSVSWELDGEGKLLVKGEPVATLTPGQWHHVEMKFRLGEGAPKEYTLTVTGVGQPAQKAKLPFASDKFTTMTALYLIASDDKPAVTYVDNLKLETQ